MRVLLLGASGAVGSHILLALLDGEHDVTLVLRSPDKFTPPSHPRAAGVRILKGDAHDYESLKTAAKEQEVFISSAGPSPSLGLMFGNPFWSPFAKALVPALEEAGVRRAVVLSGLGAGDSVNTSPMWLWLIVKTFASSYFADRTICDNLILSSSIPEKIVVRPGSFTEKPEGRTGRTIRSPETFVGVTDWIDKGDLGAWMAEQGTRDNENVNKAVIPGYEL